MSGRWWFAAVPAPCDYEVFERLQQEAYERAGEPLSYGKPDPHLTLHPGLSCDRATAAAVVDFFAERLVGRRLPVRGINLFPDARSPYFPNLRVWDGDRANGLRGEAIAEARGRGAEPFRTPVPPHVTLIQTELQEKATPDPDERGDPESWETVNQRYVVREKDVRDVADALVPLEGGWGGWDFEVGSVYAREASD